MLLQGQQHSIAMLQQLNTKADAMALTVQDLQTKADAAVAANNTLIAMSKAQAQMLRDALANGDTAAQQAAMQAVADTLDGITSADTGEVAADTVTANTPAAPAA